MPPRHRSNTAMVKLATPKRVKLPNGQAFYTKYKKATKKASPNNFIIKRRYKRRGRHQRRKNLAVKDLPEVYNKGINKIKNKIVKKAFQSDIANHLLNMGTT